MHDLNTINRLNAEAFEAAIKNFQAQGRYVLAKYEGLTLVSIKTFSTSDALRDARLAALEINHPATGTHFKTFPPTAGFHAAKRDQSEDRPASHTVEELAALGRRSVIEGANEAPERTLGDYISRKSA